MQLNRTLKNYSTYPEEQAAYEAMQEAAFKVADLIMAQEPGAFANIAGYAYWVSPLDNALEIIYAPIDNSGIEQQTVFLMSDFDGLDANDLNRIREHIEEWLNDPVFYFSDQATLDRQVLLIYG